MRVIDYDNLVIERNRNRLIVLDTFRIWKYGNKMEEEKIHTSIGTLSLTFGVFGLITYLLIGLD